MIKASDLNDRLFLAFPAGWFAGLIAGIVWASFHWEALKPELGRTLLIAVTTSQAVTLLLTTLIIRRIFPARPIETHDAKE